MKKAAIPIRIDTSSDVAPSQELPKKEWIGIAKAWLFFALLVAAVYYSFAYLRVTLPTIAGWQAVIFSFSFSFTWVYILKIGVTKPFNCITCLTGWTCLLFAFLFHVEMWYLYIFIGLTVGAIFSALKMRWL